MKNETLVNHQPQISLPDGNTPVTAPIYQTAKFTYESIDDLVKLFKGEGEGFFYSRVSNPTVAQLENLLAKLQGCEAGMAFPSGASAISSLLLSLLEKDDHAIMFIESYKTSRSFLKGTMAKFGVECDYVSVLDLEAFEKAIIPGRTKFVLFESPTNPVLKIADIDKVCAIAKKHGVTTILDGTFAGFHNHGSHPVDYYVHSLSKYAVGHGDALGGAVLSSRENIKKIGAEIRNFGAAMDANTAFLILRGMKTYFIRYKKQCENAFAVAKWLSERSDVENVLYPGLLSHPQHELAKRQQVDFGAIVSFDVKGGEAKLYKLIDSLELFHLAPSLGSADSLIAPSNLFFTLDLNEKEKKISEISPCTARLSLGLEDGNDLISDLERGLSSL